MIDFIEKWAQAIAQKEGFVSGSRSWRNCNPGNLKYVSQIGSIGEDAEGFAIFHTEQYGWLALKNQLIIACNGKSKMFKPDFTLTQFFQKYAPVSDNNDPIKYTLDVAKIIGVDKRIKIKYLYKPLFYNVSFILESIDYSMVLINKINEVYNFYRSCGIELNWWIIDENKLSGIKDIYNHFIPMGIFKAIDFDYLNAYSASNRINVFVYDVNKADAKGIFGLANMTMKYSVWFGLIKKPIIQIPMKEEWLDSCPGFKEDLQHELCHVIADSSGMLDYEVNQKLSEVEKQEIIKEHLLAL